MRTMRVWWFVVLAGAVWGEGDWTTKCPERCRCTWVGGKKTADCKDADYRSIPSGLSSELQVLDLSGNWIPILTKDAFKAEGLVNLQKLYMKNCKIETIDKLAFRDLKILIELQLSGNNISALQMETFESNERLRELYLSKNSVSKLTGSQFPPLNYLTLLDLSDCKLTSLGKKTFDKLTNLETLNLGGNLLRSISEDLLKPLTKLKSVSLQGNPWKCNCHLKPFREWVMTKDFYQKTRCAEPAHLTNFNWDDLMASDFACPPEISSLQIRGSQRQASDDLVVYGDVGSDITLECLVKANPGADVSWVRDGKVLSNFSRLGAKSYHLHTSGESERWNNLTILSADADDAGDYTCVGKNRGGLVEKNLTLMFLDIPSGEGLGAGGGQPKGPHHFFLDQSWIWILVLVLASLLCLTLVLLLVCFCSRRRRVKTARDQDVKNECKLNGSVAGYKECPTQMPKPPDPPPKLHPTNVITLSSSPGTYGAKAGKDSTMNFLIRLEEPQPTLGPRQARLHGYQGLSEFDLSDLRHSQEEGKYEEFVVGGERFLLDDRLFHPPPMGQDPEPDGPATALLNSDPDFPDLLDLPRPSPALSPLNPAALAAAFPDPPSGHRRPHSPFATASLSSYNPDRAVVMTQRPGYVTLPRRPRISSWSPANQGQVSPSPTGAIVKYDNLGPRTTADGSSIHSLNKIGEGGGTPLSGRPLRTPSHTPQPLHPFALFNFAPIEENENDQPLATLPRSWKPHERKKVPPRPPPKPQKKRTEEESGKPQEGDEGTEV